MRIISEFRDFYDSVQKYGQDDSLNFIRNPTATVHKNNPFKFTIPDWDFGRIGIVGFCGKLYPFIEAGLRENDKIVTYYFYDVKSFFEWIKSLNDGDFFIGRNLIKAKEAKKIVEKYELTGKKRKYTINWLYDKNIYEDRLSHGYSFDPYDIINCFNRIKEQENDYINLFSDNGHPIFVVIDKDSFNSPMRKYEKLSKYGFNEFKDKNKIFWNVDLKSFDFYKAVDVYSAYSAVEQWLNNQAKPEKPIPEISDEMKAQSKGFDKFSFRKQKSK